MTAGELSRLRGMSRTDWAFFLGIYAGSVSTLGTLWVLWSGVFLDRARIVVSPREAAKIPSHQTPGGSILVDREAPIVESHVKAGGAYTQVLRVDVKNRGRRVAQIVQVGQAASSQHVIFSDFLPQLSFDLPPGHGHFVVNGANGGYEWGATPLKRFYVLDGAGQIHPLRERYRQGTEKVWQRVWGNLCSVGQTGAKVWRRGSRALRRITKWRNAK